MASSIKLERKAVMEFDAMLTISGFVVDYSITTKDKMEETTQPIAYRNISRSDASTKIMYLLWSNIKPSVAYGDDKLSSLTSVISLAFFAKDAWFYNTDDGSAYFAAYNKLIETLEEYGWSLEPGGEYPEQATEGAEVYAFRKDLIISKIFF